MSTYALTKLKGEIKRLGDQHQLWSPAVRELWRAANISEGQTVLDAGCGPGFATMELKDLVGASGHVLAVDRTTDYLDYLRNKLKEQGVNNVEVKQAFLEELPLQDNSVDHVFIRWVLLFVPDLNPVLQEFARVLRTGGNLMVCDYHDFEYCLEGRIVPHSQIIDDFIATVMKYFVDNGVHNLRVGQVLPDMLHALNFKIQSTSIDMRVSAANGDVWNWALTFLKSAAAHMVAEGAYSQRQLDEVLQEVDRLATVPNSAYISPLFSLIRATLQ
ncbi:MAG: methyltransferase domain-containing protein [Pseudomonadota bacterium]|nr:methyltransferase domain-containing protein [Pseudomonadota bacterium]